MKRNFKFKLIALFLCAVMLVPTTLSCGNKPAGGAGSTTAAPADTTPVPTPADTTTTEPPTTTVPQTTTEPVTYPPVDPSLPYWEQVKTELGYHNLKNGVQILAGEDEAALMKKLSPNNVKRAELDVSKDNVPFTAAYSYTVSKDQVNFWDSSANCSFAKDVPIQQGDLVVGVIWIRGVRNPGSEIVADDDPPEYYLAIKTPTDNWNTEGEMSPAGILPAEAKWQKVWFSGRILNEETQSSTVGFNVFLGYGLQQVDIGGLIAYVFPSTDETEKGAIELTY